MRLSREIEPINWRYALGELILIVVGISLALAGNSWYENRQEGLEELQVLSQFREALENDQEEFQRIYETARDVHQKVTALLAHMSSEEPYGTNVEPYILAVTRWRGVRANVAAYEALKARGFDLISDESLRLDLIEYYEEIAPNLRDIYLNDRQMVTEQVMPYFFKNLHMADIWKFVPNDYEQLRIDPYFRNLTMYKLGRLESFMLPRFERALTRIEELQTKIAAEVERRI